MSQSIQTWHPLIPPSSAPAPSTEAALKAQHRDTQWTVASGKNNGSLFLASSCGQLVVKQWLSTASLHDQLKV